MATQTHTTESLAQEFLSRANAHGWVRLTTKQGAWLYSLAAREGMTASRYGVRVAYGHLDAWKLVEERNGSWTISRQTTERPSPARA